MRLHPGQAQEAAAAAARRRYLDHPTPRNRMDAETKALVAGVAAPEPPAPKPAAQPTGD